MKKSIILFSVIVFLASFFVNNLCKANENFLQEKLFLNYPYAVNPLGDGEDSVYSPGKLARIDCFDCTTYVETVLAKHRQSLNKTDFYDNIIQLRYVDGQIGFFSRAHIMEYHWIPNALKYGFIKKYPIKNTKKTNLNLNLQTWFLQNKFVKKKDNKYLELAKKQPSMINASVNYLEPQNITNNFIANLPNFMVVFFIKEISANTWAGQSKSQKLITHMGIYKDGFLYHASTTEGKVVKTDLLAYLKNNSKIIGLSFYEVNQ